MHDSHSMVGRFTLTLGECGKWHVGADIVHRDSIRVRHFLVVGACGIQFNLVLQNLKESIMDSLYC